MKTQRKTALTEESIEAKRSISGDLKNLGTTAVDSFWKDFLTDTVKGVGGQLEGFISQAENELKEGQEVNLKKDKQEKKPQVTEAHMEYFREVKNADVISENKENYQVKQQIEELRIELKRLTSASKLVERAVKDAAADKAPVKVGKYHIRFFEFVLSVVKDATRKLEDAASFGALISSKKQQRSYWNMYKKHGTTFGLSGERTTATQTG